MRGDSLLLFRSVFGAACAGVIPYTTAPTVHPFILSRERGFRYRTSVTTLPRGDPAMPMHLRTTEAAPSVVASQTNAQSTQPCRFGSTMRLNKIKLAGFKSFVDPTSVSLPGNLIGVVGP